MTITRDFRSAARRDTYRILSSLVIPRPIAWVSTLGADGRANLAPFSSFMGIFDPPALAITFGRRSDGSMKDSHRNIRERAEAVVHLADGNLLHALHASAEEVPAEVSEVERLGLATVPSVLVGPPRVAEAPVALECRLREEHPLGESSDLVLLDVMVAHVAEALWNVEIDCADGSLWQPLCRLGSLGGPNYALPGERFALGRPKLPG
jgi:flavin reductase (DIM6/NTAB) family NADH-FMN oxidoreductase RutF